jgi:hypothetical protein
MARFHAAIFAPAIEYSGEPDLMSSVSQHGRQAVYIDPFQWVIYGGFSIN